MANAAGMIFESIWRDSDWRKLSRGAQALYMQLLSQHCGGGVTDAFLCRECVDTLEDNFWTTA